MKTANPSMIELARNSRGVSQKDLAGLLPRWKQPTLSKMERGELPISEEAIEEIAKVLDYPVSFFYQSEPKSPVSMIYFRKRASIPQKHMEKIFADVKIILRGIDTIMQDIELKEYPRYIFDLSEGWTPEAAATRMREILEIPNGKPVKDLITKIEDMGVMVYYYDSPNERFDGLTIYTDNGIPVIFVNKNFPNDRLKFTIAHEMFHLVMHLPCNIEPWRDFELEANEATSAFFMPGDACASDLVGLNYHRLGELKSYWGVSKQAIIRRAKDLHQISEATYKYLMIEIGRRGERKVESGYVEIDKPKIIPTIIKLLKDELGYTKEKLADMLCLNLSDYSFLFDPNSDGAVRLKVVKKSA